MQAAHATLPQTRLYPKVTDFPRDFLDLPDLDTPSPLRKAAQFRQRLIHYPEYLRARAAIERCHQMGRGQLRQPDCLLITGLSGSGKSTLGERYEQDYPKVEEATRTRIPVLYLELPSAPSIKTVAEAVLSKFGDPFASQGTAQNKTARIIKLLMECGVEIVILDEFQHFLTDNGKVDYKVADWLKQIINATRIPFVLTGTPKCKRILEVNEQLRRRFLHRIELAPFRIGTQAEAAQFVGVLKALESNLPLSGQSRLTEPQLVRPLYYATAGLIDYLVKLLGQAIEIAESEGSDQIDRSVLERAFKELIMPSCTSETNPFSPRILNREGEPFYANFQI